MEIVSSCFQKIVKHSFPMTEWLKDRSTIIVNKPQRPLVTLPTIIVDSEFMQLQYWTMYLSDLSACGEDIGKMSHIINFYTENSEISIHISSVHNYHLDWDHLDTLAHSLWPRNGPMMDWSPFRLILWLLVTHPCSISR